jgi:hypothetical protein
MKGLYTKRHGKAVLMLADNNNSSCYYGSMNIFVDAGRHDACLISFLARQQFQATYSESGSYSRSRDKCTVSAPDIVVIPNVAPCQFVQMVNKKQ